MAGPFRGTVKKARVPKNITKIGMTPEQYYELKVYIKTIVVPGTPPFDFRPLATHEQKVAYHQWVANALKTIGPRFFPGGAGTLVWPRDQDKIYSTISGVVHVLRPGCRKNYAWQQAQFDEFSEDGFYEDEFTDDEFYEYEFTDDEFTDSEFSEDDHPDGGPAGGANVGKGVKMSGNSAVVADKKFAQYGVKDEKKTQLTSRGIRPEPMLQGNLAGSYLLLPQMSGNPAVVADRRFAQYGIKDEIKSEMTFRGIKPEPTPQGKLSSAKRSAPETSSENHESSKQIKKERSWDVKSEIF
ncbi:hypothetical protein L873DRAFT_1812217 [Choiromyces venosus 120613-1]|uniref:Uncharacterized protein n=1 Tax=Choiromyces venosus 120613-1 TaxID=1336337 RepID=A0A3N4JGR4_9PEZI|nr:hypothetical protein L873DRAFT_1812217 [Choiromyces venosus 120613-1]